MLIFPTVTTRSFLFIIAGANQEARTAVQGSGNRLHKIRSVKDHAVVREWSYQTNIAIRRMNSQIYDGVAILFDFLGTILALASIL